jgi:predicted DsbA family dithiol-disulfide isomerase
MFSNKTSFSSIIIVVASMFWAQTLCGEFTLFPRPDASDVLGEIGRHYNDAGDFPTWVGIEQGVSEEGFPTLGSADAPIIIAEFADFSCPHCLNFLPDVQRLTENYVRDGQAQLWYIPMTFVSPEQSTLAAKAGLCAAQQGAFWQLHQVIFEIQESQGSASFTVDHLAGAAAEIGLDEGAMRDCLQSSMAESTLEMATTAQTENGVTGTPSIIYSLDGGATWTLLEDRTYPNIVDLIEAANE